MKAFKDLLTEPRPAAVNIYSILRDEIARLPNGKGSVRTIAELLKRIAIHRPLPTYQQIARRALGEELMQSQNKKNKTTESKKKKKTDGTDPKHANSMVCTAGSSNMTTSTSFSPIAEAGLQSDCVGVGKSEIPLACHALACKEVTTAFALEDFSLANDMVPFPVQRLRI
ncbi:hypothetical protein GHT06_017145 [Daphnia sinensis]|uniref:Nuclear factor related to kappa-B-binding protein second winged helix domain-containing protein n=1 Tax=Daphnia sinensis TaxID=1820382 RepID=A0AAD5KR62_9CRUS|nr:hypothetical protein GHT06_017145 [Daphnia sinensis]